MRFFTLALLISFMVGCAHESKVEKPARLEMEEGVSLVGEQKASRYGNIYFSAQPKISDLKTLKKQGFRSIVNLRRSSEYDEASEKKMASELGIHYAQVPFDGKSGKLDDSFISAVTKAVVAHRKAGKVLVHCSSGNRVGLWVGGHFKKDHGYSAAEALATAKKSGLKNEGLEKKLKNYLGL